MSELVVKTEWHEVSTSKLEAVKACHERDAERLISLLKQYVKYEGHKGPGTSPRTLDAYETGLKRWLKWTESKGTHLLRVTKRDVQLFLIELAETCKAGTCANYLSGIKSFYAALRWAEATDLDPCNGVRAPKDSRPRHERRNPVPLEGFKRMLELAGNERDVAILHMLGSQGLRISECAALDLADVRGGVVKVRKGKGGKSRTVPMTKGAQAALEAWLSVRTTAVQETALFINLPHLNTRHDRVGKRITSNTIRTMFHQVRETAGLPKDLSPHSLRHTALTRIYQRSKDLQVTARIAGHTDVSTTTIYAHMDLSALEEVMQDID